MAETTAPKGKGENVLTKKYGKLKGWQIAALVAGGVGVVYYIRKQQANSANAGTTAATTAGTDTTGTGADTSSTQPGFDGTGLADALAQQGQQSQADEAAISQLSAAVTRAQSNNAARDTRITALQKQVAALKKKLTPKKAAAKKPVAKKPPAKKAPKPAVKKPTIKKAPAKKAATKVSNGAPVPVRAGIPR